MNAGTAKFVRIALGIVAANLFGAAAVFLFVLAVTIAAKSQITAWLLPLATYPNLILMPMAMGIVAAYVWRTLRMGLPEHLLSWFVSCLVLPIGGWLAFREGMVCLLIGWPIVFVSGFAGVVLGRFWFQRTKGSLNATLLPLFCLALFADARLRQPSTAVIADELSIRAPASEVWKHVIAFPPIAQRPGYWLNRFGLPAPLATTCDGPFVGAERRCVFTNGLVFNEAVSQVIPEHVLTFDIVEQPRDPELLGHLELLRGEFELLANGDGTTKLIGRSWYRLHMRPRWYFDLWTRDISSHVHLRVMQHVKQLSEAAR